MSAGPFSSSKYESDQGGIFRARVQPETLLAVIDGATNAAPAGAVDQPVSARMRGSRRAIGVTARKVSLRWTSGAPTDYKDEPVSIPIMTPAVFNGINPGQTGTYLGSAVEVISKTAEQLR